MLVSYELKAMDTAFHDAEVFSKYSRGVYRELSRRGGISFLCSRGVGGLSPRWDGIPNKNHSFLSPVGVGA